MATSHGQTQQSFAKRPKPPDYLGHGLERLGLLDDSEDTSSNSCDSSSSEVCAPEVEAFQMMSMSQEQKTHLRRRESGKRSYREQVGGTVPWNAV